MPCGKDGKGGGAVPRRACPGRNEGALDAGTLDSLVSGGLFSELCEEIKPPVSRPK